MATLPKKNAGVVIQKEINKKTIINQSLQSFPVCVLSSKGSVMVTLRPKESIQILETEVSKMVLNLANRKIVKII